MVDPISPDQKPFSSSELRVRIDDLLGGHRTVGQKRINLALRGGSAFGAFNDAD